MNRIEKALMHALFVHLHHNIDKVIDFGIFKKLNEKVNRLGRSLLIGPDANDDAAVFRMPGDEGLMVAKDGALFSCVPSLRRGGTAGRRAMKAGGHGREAPLA